MQRLGAPEECISSFLINTSNLEQGRGRASRQHPEPMFLRSTPSPLDNVPNLSLQDGREASFTERLAWGDGRGVQFASYTVPWGWEPLENHFSDGQSPVGPRNASPPTSHQSQPQKLGQHRLKPRARVTYTAPHQETLPWGPAEGEGEDIPHLPRSLKRITVSPRCVIS